MRVGLHKGTKHGVWGFFHFKASGFSCGDTQVPTYLCHTTVYFSHYIKIRLQSGAKFNPIILKWNPQKVKHLRISLESAGYLAALMCPVFSLREHLECVVSVLWDHETLPRLVPSTFNQASQDSSWLLERRQVWPSTDVRLLS